MPEANTTAGHNVAARGEQLRQSFQKILKLEVEKDALKDKHIKPISDEITKMRRTLKADLDMDAKDLKLAYALFKREAEAMDFEDPNDKDRVMDNLKEIFQALRQGETLDFLDGLDASEGDDQTEAAA